MRRRVVIATAEDLTQPSSSITLDQVLIDNTVGRSLSNTVVYPEQNIHYV